MKKKLLRTRLLIFGIIPVALFFAGLNELIFNRINIISDSIVVFFSALFSALIGGYIYMISNKKVKISSNLIDKADDRKPKEIHSYCSQQRLVYNEFFEFFSKNLQDTVKITEETITEFIKALELLYQKSKEQTEQIKDSLHSGGELLEIIEKQALQNKQVFDKFTEIIDLNYKEIQENSKRIFEIQKEVSRALPLMDSIQYISEQIKILAINASIESARVGEKGAGFAVIAGEIRKLADKTEITSKNIINEILSINKMIESQYENLIRKLEGARQMEILNEIVQKNEEIQLELDKAGEIINKVLNDIQSSNERIFGIVTELLGKVQFQDVVRQRLEKLSEQIKELGDYNRNLHCWVENPSEHEKPPQIRELLDKFYKNYVMQSQRDLHKEVFEGSKSEDKAASKIELF